jgi:hypothetical protein
MILTHTLRRQRDFMRELLERGYLEHPMGNWAWRLAQARFLTRQIDEIVEHTSKRREKALRMTPAEKAIMGLVESEGPMTQADLMFGVTTQWISLFRAGLGLDSLLTRGLLHGEGTVKCKRCGGTGGKDDLPTVDPRGPLGCPNCYGTGRERVIGLPTPGLQPRTPDPRTPVLP